MNKISGDLHYNALKGRESDQKNPSSDAKHQRSLGGCAMHFGACIYSMIWRTTLGTHTACDGVADSEFG